MFLLMTLGSLGDFMPFLALADRLRQRGHRVTLASNAGYASMAQAMGIEFAAIWQRTDQSLDDLIAKDPARAWQAVRQQMFLPAIEPAKACIRHFTAGRDCTVLAAWTVLGARMAHQQSRFPLASLYLSPAAIEQDEQRAANETLIGLFPEWFGGADSMALPGFVMMDSALLPPLSADLEGFLQQGPPPLVFTPGSYMRGADDFFRHSLAACETLGQRAIFLTPYAQQLPALPATVRHDRYVPLRHLLPRAGALVHHGGVGTCAEALRAGIPQLVSALFFDQPDNGERLKALGVADILATGTYKADLLAQKLKALLDSDAVKKHCETIAARFEADGTDRLCDLIEKLE